MLLFRVFKFSLPNARRKCSAKVSAAKIISLSVSLFDQEILKLLEHVDRASILQSVYFVHAACDTARRKEKDRSGDRFAHARFRDGRELDRVILRDSTLNPQERREIFSIRIFRVHDVLALAFAYESDGDLNADSTTTDGSRSSESCRYGAWLRGSRLREFDSRSSTVSARKTRAH